MKVYQHVIIIITLVLFTIFFYKYGFGSIAFILATIYLVTIFVKEVKRSRKNEEI